MKHIVGRLALVVILSMGLTACATMDRVGQAISNTVSTVTATAVTPKDVVIAASAFDVVTVTATNYLRLRRCDGTNGPVCRDPAVRQAIAKAIYAGRAARNNLKAYLRANPGVTSIRLADYDTLLAATDTVNKATAAYRSAQ